MCANPGLSGGRPGCWPNNPRLKGERGARGAAAPGRHAPDPGGPPAPGTPGPQDGAQVRGRRPAPLGSPGRSRGVGLGSSGPGASGGWGARPGKVGPPPLRLRGRSQAWEGRGGALTSQTGRAPPERDPGFQRRLWPGPSASLGI